MGTRRQAIIPLDRVAGHVCFANTNLAFVALGTVSRYPAMSLFCRKRNAKHGVQARNGENAPRGLLG